MTKLIYLTDSYKRESNARVMSVTKTRNHWEVILDQTIFYPQGGGQPSDKGKIKTKQGLAHVKHVRLKNDIVIHECTIDGEINVDDKADLEIDWDIRFYNMRNHSGGHIVHEAVKIVAPQLIPLKGEHGDHSFIAYKGTLPADHANAIEQKANAIVSQNVSLVTEFVTKDELLQRSAWIPEHLPTNKPLRILTIGNYSPIPDGGTQVATSSEVGAITIDQITNEDETVHVYYHVEKISKNLEVDDQKDTSFTSSAQLIGALLSTKEDAIQTIKESDKPIELLRIEVLGPKSDFTNFTKQMKSIAPNDRQAVGVVINEVKNAIEEALVTISKSETLNSTKEWIDETQPGIRPPEGHLHIVTQAISEITHIFERIGFTRVRHPEVDWDYYAFESLNMPANHPARDEWETFFVETQNPSASWRTKSQKGRDSKFNKIVLTPHTSNGQVREMEKGNLPIRMINIAKCYRRQIDVSHTPMFHQFEGLYVDKGVSISHLKGVFDYFVKQFYGPDRTIRLRPFHFQFTEPSFEVDINCGICLGKSILPNGQKCRLCKSGWLEMAGSGMVHPNVLKAGGIDPNIYSGFAFGWGVERAYMMKNNTQIDDIRLIYNNDVRFLKQF